MKLQLKNEYCTVRISSYDDSVEVKITFKHKHIIETELVKLTKVLRYLLEACDAISSNVSE